MGCLAPEIIGSSLSCPRAGDIRLHGIGLAERRLPGRPRLLLIIGMDEMEPLVSIEPFKGSVEIGRDVLKGHDPSLSWALLWPRNAPFHPG